MLEPNFNPFPILTTERLLLREPNLGDVNEFLFLRSNPQVMKYLKRAPCQSVEEAIAYIDKLEGMARNNEGITWVITAKGDEKLIGTIAFWRIEREHYRAEIGYVLHPDWQRQGIVYEAMSAVLEYGFNTMKLHSVEANTNPENKPSQRALEKHNFIREGFFKENYHYDGKFFDSSVYSLVAPRK